MRSELFRQEALDAAADRHLGEVNLVLPPGTGWLVAAAVLAAASLIGFAFQGEYTRKSHVTGYLAPDKGLIKVFPHADGIVIERRVAEGQSVRKGDALFLLSTERSSAAGQEVQAAAIGQLKLRLDSLRRELGDQAEIAGGEEASLRARVRGLEAESAQLQGELLTQQARLESAEGTARRFAELAQRRFVAAIQAQEKTEALLDQRFRLQELQHRRIAADRDLTAAWAELALHGVKAASRRAAIERDIAALTQELTEQESRREVLVTAPVDGRATAILAEPGQQAQAGRPLLAILPAGAVLEAQLLVPSRAIGFVAAGQSVSVRYQAFPHQRFGAHTGRVKEISKTLLSPAEASVPVTLQESVYRVTVSLDAQSVLAYRSAVPLQAGMLLDADIRLDRRRLIDWVFDPLLSIGGRL